MDPDSYQKAWHAQSSQTRVTIDADLLRKEVQRSEQNFRAMIFGRDFRELAIGLVMLPLWFYLGHRYSLPWTWWLAIPAITWVCLFIVVDRIRHKQWPSRPGEPLIDCVNSSLTQVEHQIWLLRNVFWWYLLPFTIAIMAFFTQSAWLNNSGFWPITFALAPFVLFLLVLYGFVYYLNQYAVRRDLVPRREELLTLRASLGDETTGEHVSATTLDDIKNPGVLGQALFVTVLSAVAVALMFLADSWFPSGNHALQSNRGTPATFANLITDLRREKKLVGLAAMVTVDGQVVASAVDGERKVDSGVELEIDDRWHLGAIAQSITATMIARLVESGQLSWSTTVGECFPEAQIHDDWKPVTFKELLTNTAGAPANFPIGIWLEKPALGPECTLARRKAVLDVLAEKPVHPPGEKYEYSNVGYTIAAAMVEKITGQTWDGLVRREVFDPLSLTGTGFGPPKSPDESLPQPRGHRPLPGSKLAVGDDVDNTPIIGPAGGVHMSLADLSAFGTEHLRGDRGTGKLLSAETYKLLHAPTLGQYACGWVRNQPGTAIPYTVYWHNGTNTLWYALVVFIPEKNMVVAVTSNDGDTTQAEDAAWKIVRFAINDLKPAADFPRKSPFAGVRWQQSQPEVQIGGEWVKLVSLDDVSAAEIVTFSQQTYGSKWQKRFEEDLVELLTRMGHPPQDTVKLVVQSLASSETQTFQDVPMTEANRRVIFDAARARERGE
jgi:CubicO group peptidase (beta-lactamase class C family)